MKAKYIINTSLAVFIFVVFISGCKLTVSQQTQIRSNKNVEQPSVKTVSINAIDLSEDMSILSSQNDEIIILFFNPSDSSELPVKGQIVTNNFTKGSGTFNFNLEISVNDIFISVMIEEDSDAPPEVVDSIVRHNIDTLTASFRSNDYTRIRTILGDDDVLDIRTITDSTNYTVQGIHKMDKYKYHITFDK